MAEAWQVFQSISNPTIVSWNALILGCVENEQCSLALEIFSQTRAPNSGTFTAAVMACSGLAEREEWQELDRCLVKIKSLEQGMVIHSRKQSAGLPESLFVENSLIDMYSKCGCLLDARMVFDRMKFHDVVSWNSLLLGYVENGFCVLALELFSRMETSGLRPDPRTFVAALIACAPEESTISKEEEENSERKRDGLTTCLEKTMALHSQAAAAGLVESQIFVANTLVDLYGKCGSSVDARKVFDRMAHHSTVSWNALLLGYVECGESELAMEVFLAMEEIKDRGVTPNSRTYLAALKACAEIAGKEEEHGKKRLEEHEEVDEELRKNIENEELDVNLGRGGRGPKLKSLKRALWIDHRLPRGSSDIFIENTLIELYSNCGSLLDARRVFDSMPLHNLVSWNAMVVACVENGEPEMGMDLLDSIRDRELLPDAQILVSTLAATTSLDLSLENGTIQMPSLGKCCKRRIHALACRWGLETNQLLASSAIDLYAKSGGSMPAAQHIFDSSPSPSARACWNALLAGYSIHGHCDRVLDLFAQMRREATDPDAITLLAILAACSRGGMPDLARRILAAMPERHGISPSARHYACVADALARAGRGGEAVEVVAGMPVAADGACWMAVLGSCRRWRNVAAAEKAFQELLKIDESKPAAYLLMANTYCY
ncbi:pentatricopeptide repeat-containing protein At4g39530 [Selaginella moellendorffii]|nr:pentatricopeptide repeat-containing protein At4g39530 [Selaginella moellendorffii]|eukprot:XP_002975581.2 pentatricopeptide repeat-containing protein At4g39530 [Selaginella moellendorffii]